MSARSPPSQTRPGLFVSKSERSPITGMARMKSKRTWDSGRLPLLDDHQVANRADARSTRSSQSKRGSTDRPGRHRRARSYSMTSSRGSSNSPPAARVKTRHPSERDRPLLDEGRQPYHGHLRGAPLITRRPPSPSQMSIFSDQTQRTGFSSESNKTITQESYDRAQKRPSERFDIFQFLEPEPPQDDNEGVQRAEDKKDDVINGSKSASLEQDGADGHEPPYDEEEEDVDEEDWLSGSDDEDATPQDLVPRHRPLTPNSDARSVRSSGLWDSGISMGGDSPEVVKRERVALPATIHDLSDPTTPVKPPAAPQREGLGPHDALQRLQSPSPGRMQQSRASPSTHSSSARDLSGYELIAWSLSSRSTKAKGDQTLPPVYRNFEQLQHRTLLHLQDTIAEIEMEIRKLDESIAPYFVDATGGRHPQSRRYDRLRMHTIGAQRHQLLDGLSHYLAQYNQLLSSFKSTDFGPATNEQITTYKRFLHEHNAVVHHESSFLDHPADLICLSSSTSSRQTTDNQKPLTSWPRHFDFLAGLLVSMLIIGFGLMLRA